MYQQKPISIQAKICIYNFIMDILVIRKKLLRQSRYLQPDPVCDVLMMFVLFLISRYFVGDVWSKGGYNWYRDSWGWWMILAILAISHLAPGHHSSQLTAHMLHKSLRFAFFCPKSLSSAAAISLRSDLTQSGQIETTASSGQRVLMTSNYWSQELESRGWAGHCRVNRNTDPG